MPTRTGSSLYATSAMSLHRSAASLHHAATRTPSLILHGGDVSPASSASEYAINRLGYGPGLYHHEQLRRRLSSTGENSGDSSTTASGSSYGEREDSSEGRPEPEDTEHSAPHHDDPAQGQVSEAERLQVEMFFHGLKTEVYVCSSLANLYMKTPSTDWELKFTGIPVVLLDMGEARARNKRRIQILLAERGSCFMLWRDTIDNLSAYKVAGKAFHTMCLSSDHSTEIGLSFDTNQSANDMWSHIERLVSCPENISLSAPGKKKKKERRSSKPARLPPKSHISQPCCFQHVTSVDRTDRMRYFSLQELVPAINEVAGGKPTPPLRML